MDKKKEILQKIKEADAILIGASNGLSITEGLNLFADNQVFLEVFGDFKRKYGFRNILDGYFYNWGSLEEKWAFYSRLINHYSSSYKGSEVMQALKKLVGDRPYFIVTSNAEGHFQLAGFDPERVFEIEGNWVDMRCEKQCHDTLYSTLEAAKRMQEHEENGKVSLEMIPRCPKCGGYMSLYHANPVKKGILENWKQFLNTYHGKKIVILELGIGWRNQLIKAPLMGLTAQEEQATYITINLGEVYITDNIKEKSYGIDGKIQEVLQELLSDE